MKRITALLCCAAILFAIPLHGYVNGVIQNRVYAEKVSAEAGKEFCVPVKISGNTGFMGFAVTVTYDPLLLKPVSVQGGSMLSGLFEDSIGYSETGSFRVVFSGSEGCVGNGDLFTLTFEALSAASEVQTATIGLTCSKQDTFNEQWQDVVFNCEDIEVKFGGSSTEPTEEPEETTVPEVNPQPAKKLSERLAEWYSARPAVVRILLWLIVKPLIRMIAATE